ncbi:MAG: aconitate hydratase [Acidimicrobiaceae bacterium]|nr:aconitate hydratase [Acidimicrobiia bacterium]MCY4493688.1 aconitate hydratase [Acidimicrobiaceae bacterium]
MSVAPSTPIELVEGVYATLDQRIGDARTQFGRPLTLAEKILVNHLDRPDQELVRGDSYVDYRPDRVAMQDATAQMAWLQFMTTGLDEVAVPTTTHCDHLIQARTDGKTDLLAAVDTNREVYDFLESVSAKYGGGFWKPGSGIIHQVVLEQYAFPGGMIIGTDSHTPNGGGIGMVAVGVGGADVVDVMTGSAWNSKWPMLIGVKLTGSLNGWAAPKDVILKVAEILTVKGGTGAIVEYFGEGAASLSCTGKATICNMGAEIGATTSLFAYDDAVARYLKSTGREAFADAAVAVAHHLRSDDEVLNNPHDFYDRVIEIDLDRLTPHINGPHTPDLAREVAELGGEAEAEGWPLEISAALIGSCTNSSYEDITRAASIARAAAANGLRARTRLLVTPGSEQIRATIVRDGLLADFEALGATVLANACGPCIGQWDRSGEAGHLPGVPNVIVTSYNRNFPKRNDGDPQTLAFVTSPETVIALALAGTLDFDPLNDTITNDAGVQVSLATPVGVELPEAGFDPGDDKFLAPPADRSGVVVAVSPTSDRLQLLEAFKPWDGNDYEDLAVLVKAKGKFTTDHISMAGPWLRYRGHLENISGNLFAGAVNAFDGYEVGHGKSQLDGSVKPFPELARDYHEAGLRWVVIGDENMGEGSSREHAAMEPRFRNGVVAFARSFARIHETNLKKQGMLALTFADRTDYDRIGQDDRIAVRGLADLAPGTQVTVEVTPRRGESWSFAANHTFSADQIEWFKAGSALNIIRQAYSGLHGG